MNFALLTDKNWHDDLFEHLQKKHPQHKWFRVQKKSDFTIGFLKEQQIDKVFIPHWSHIIPAEIHSQIECIVFHMTDLPFGRGGSPLQHLIKRKIKETKVSALRITEVLDGGDIYLKAPLKLHGTAQEIFMRCSVVIGKMIDEIISTNPTPVAQSGTPVVFDRRTPDMSSIHEVHTIEDLYDHIRMLDAEGYPKAFIESEDFKIEFSEASIEANQTIVANVRISKK